MRKASAENVKPLKVIILGTAHTHAQAPLDEEGFARWAVSPWASREDTDASKCDVLFELHPERYWKRPDIVERLTSFHGPVMMQDHYEEIPNSVRYPIEKVREVFQIPAMPELYVTNTISYMVALAYLEGFEEYHFYGVHMSHDTEYGYQKPNCEYYLGYLAALGKKIVLPPGGELLRTPYLYGYNEPWQDISALAHDYEMFGKDIAQLDEKMRALERERWQKEGAKGYAKQILHVKGAY